MIAPHARTRIHRPASPSLQPTTLTDAPTDAPTDPVAEPADLDELAVLAEQAVDSTRDVSSDAVPESPAETRRERLRRETVEEIKAAARTHLTLEATSQLSLRAVARDVGLTPSAIYRYFQSQQELMGAVANDAYASAAAALRECAQQSEGWPTESRLRQLGHTYRQWAHEHKAEFNLIFSTDQTDPSGGAATVSTRSLEEFFAVPVSIYVEAVHSGELDATRALIPDAPELTPAAMRFASSAGIDLSPATLNLLLCAWGAFHGFVMLELFGHLGRFYTDPREAFDRHLRAVLAAMGMPPG